jgi:hypothetical protein
MPPERDKELFISGAVIMGLLAVMLFFVPLVNGVIAGVIGGYRIAHPRRAMVAALFAALPAAVLLFLMLGPVSAPVIGVPEVPAPGLLVATAVIGLPVGALIGGMVASAPMARHREV